MKKKLKIIMNFDWSLAFKVYVLSVCFIMIALYVTLSYEPILENEALYTLSLIMILYGTGSIANTGQFTFKNTKGKYYDANTFGAIAYIWDILAMGVFINIFSFDQDGIEFLAAITTLLMTLHAYTIMVPHGFFRIIKSELKREKKYIYNSQKLYEITIGGETVYTTFIYIAIRYMVGGALLTLIPVFYYITGIFDTHFIYFLEFVILGLILVFIYYKSQSQATEIKGEIYIVKKGEKFMQPYYKVIDNYIKAFEQDIVANEQFPLFINTENEKNQMLIDSNQGKLSTLNLGTIYEETIISYVYKGLISKTNANTISLTLLMIITNVEYLVFALSLGTIIKSPTENLIVWLLCVIATGMVAPYIFLYKNKCEYKFSHYILPALKMDFKNGDPIVFLDAHLLTAEQTRELHVLIAKLAENDISVIVTGDINLYKNNIELTYLNIAGDNNKIMNKYYWNVIY